MASEAGSETTLKPRLPVRRFDIFAEYNRQKAMADGMSADEASGYGLWVAKVVASRRYGGPIGTKPPSKPGEQEGVAVGGEEAGDFKHGKWHTLNDEPQTDELFDKEIVRRMGRDFYEQVFMPAIQQAILGGRSYNAIRDTLRKEWKP